MDEVELYRKYRPTLFKGVIGQSQAVSVLMQMVKAQRVPHALLFTGPSGCGKTTLARILRMKLGCGDGDFQEINAADFRGIDTIRDLRTRMSLAPIHGKCRVCLLDEVHSLSKDAQNSFLKILEDTPKHYYFMLATTDPNKLIKTIITRCTEIKLKAMQSDQLRLLIKDVAAKEKLIISEEVEDKIIECSQDSARLALVLLNKLIGLDEKEHLDAVEKNASNVQSIALARALFDLRSSWSDIAAILKKIDDEPESVRWLVLSYASSVLLSGGKLAGRAYDIIQAFRDHWFDCKKAGLVAACFEIISAKR